MLLLEEIRGPRVTGFHVRQEQTNLSESCCAKAAPSRASAADSPAPQQQGHAVKQQRLHSQSKQLTRASGEGKDKGDALQQRHAVAQHCGTGTDVAALTSDMQEQRDGDEHDSKAFLDSVDCLDID